MRLSASPDRGGVAAAPVATAPRSLLGILFSRAALGSAALADRLGRSTLYAGLLLVAFTGLRAFGDLMTVADPFLLFSVLCALVAVFYRGSVNLGLFRAHLIGLALIVAGVAIAAVYTRSEEWTSLLNLGKYVFSATCMFFACSALLRRSEQLKTALSFWVVSACLTAVIGLLQAWLRDPIVADEAIRWQRMAGLSGNPNHLGVIAGMAIAPALSLAAMSRGPVQAGWLLAVVLAACGVVVSASRTGALAAAGSFALWIILHYRLRKEFTLFAAGCCLAGTIVIGFVHVQWWGGQNIVARLEKAAGPTADHNVEWRLAQFDRVFDRAITNPLIGTGLTGDQGGVHVGLVHNMYLRILHGGGFLALAGLLIILGDLVHKGMRRYLAAGGYESGAMAAGLTSGVGALLLAGLTEPLLYQRPVWIPAALLFASCAIPRQEKRRRARRSSGHTSGGASNAEVGSRPQRNRPGERTRSGPSRRKIFTPDSL
jgi:O-antigen ligase